VEWEIHILLTIIGHCKRLKIPRKFYVENMDRKHHLGDLGADGRIKFYARLHGVTSRKTLSATTFKKTSYFLSD
jgi:hypothetical protein